MTTVPLRRSISARLSSLGRSVVVALALLVLVDAAVADEGPAQAQPLRVAVYDAPPYGHVEPDGSIDGVSVDLWRRAAEVMGRRYRFVPVSQTQAILDGLEQNKFDAAIGAITITPERLARVDFSYPAHRSGVAVAVRKDRGATAALRNLRRDHRGTRSPRRLHRRAAGRDGRGDVARRKAETIGGARIRRRFPARWRVLGGGDHTTVGYGDKTPKTTSGRMIAIAWMLASVALVSILSTSLVAKMTADRVAGGYRPSDVDLQGKRLAAVAYSSGAEYLDERHLSYTPFDDLAGALTALGAGQADAVVNSVGALQYLIAARFGGTVETPQGILAPAYMAFALPHGSALKEPLDRALIEITASPEWRRIEQS